MVIVAQVSNVAQNTLFFKHICIHVTTKKYPCIKKSVIPECRAWKAPEPTEVKERSNLFFATYYLSGELLAYMFGKN